MSRSERPCRQYEARGRSLSFVRGYGSTHMLCHRRPGRSLKSQEGACTRSGSDTVGRHCHAAAVMITSVLLPSTHSKCCGMHCGMRNNCTCTDGCTYVDRGSCSSWIIVGLVRTDKNKLA